MEEAPERKRPMAHGPVRAFVAVELTDAVRAALGELTGSWKRLGARVSWVPPENLHLTLLFLGDIEWGRVEAVGRIMDAAAGETPAFQLAAAGAGYFGSPASPRVLWAGFAELSASLSALQRSLSVGLAGRGFDVSRKAFRPHVTLGRVRGRCRVAALTAAVASAKNTCFGIVPVRRVVLMQSTLSPHGAHYTLLHESRLQGVESHGGQEERRGG